MAKNDKATNPKADQLLKDGTLTLTGESRQAVTEAGVALVADIPLGTTWTRGIISEADGVFSQTYSLIKTK